MKTIKLLGYFLLIQLAVLSACREPEVAQPKPPSDLSLLDNYYVDINLNNREGDTFKVNFFLEGLTADNAVFQFPAVVPGTYSISDVGRFVKNFNVYDQTGGPLTWQQISTNQWQIDNPENAYRISYEVSETFDTPVNEHPIYTMAGTSINDERVLLNTFDVIGYPTGLKERDYYIHIDKPSGWNVGTSLPIINDLYYADNYDHLADSPLLLGDITSAKIISGSTTIDIYSYSPMGLLPADNFTTDLGSLIDDASAFLNGLPVNHYSFIYLFDPKGGGALEHSYSSMYVLHEVADYPIKNISAHEFFHIVTPLNIHSEIIENYNFAEPIASEHLWLYEGVTEWAAHIMQLRNHSITLDDWIQNTRQKISSNRFRDVSYSLAQMSLESFTDKGQDQYNFIYTTGALVATFLDIRLLELSQGNYGLRELILDLINTYGKDKPFPETSFFDVIEQMTYPEIGDFIRSYITGTDPLPIAEYFNKIGLQFDDNTTDLIPVANPSANQTFLLDKWSTNL